MSAEEPLTREELAAVEKALKTLDLTGYWYPPDAIQAVHEGRHTYHALDPAITYAMAPLTRARIQRALKAAAVRQPPRPVEEYFSR